MRDAKRGTNSVGSKWFHNIRRGGIPRVLAEGIRARIFPGTHLMLSVVDLDPWSESPVHSHMNEQWGVCLEGAWIRIQDGREYPVTAGDFWQTPPHVPHGGRTLGRRCRILDIFAPPREEYKGRGHRRTQQKKRRRR
jgi:quercetin dioxygenase-like cupin family protein